jgi:hypothetical protein
VAPIGGRAGQGHRIVDDRGFMYVRHGEPRARVHCAGGGGLGAPPTTSWVYTVPEGTWIVHFARGRFTATPSLATEPLGMGARGQGTMQVSSCLNRLAAADPRFGILAMEREGRSAMQMLKALSAAMLGGDPRELYSPDRSVNHVVQLAARDRATAERALRTDTYPLHFEEDLAPVIQLHAVGTPASGATGVLAVFAVPGDRLTPGPAAPDGRTTYPLRIRLVAADTGGRAMHTVDTLRTFAVRGALGKGSWLNGIVELPLPPGAYDVRMLVTQPDTERGGAGGRLGVVIPSGAAALTMSDVVAGDARSGLVWRSHGAAVPLNPLGVFRRDAAVELYYELGGLRPGTGYRTMIEIGRGDAATDRVTVSFSETAESRVARVARSIGVQALPGGRYVLRVTVTEDGTGREVVHERWLDIRPGDPR